MQNAETTIEWIDRRQVPFRAAMFDFDGTLSLLREDWPEIMIGMMVDRLLETGTSETRQQLHDYCEQFVMELNGKPTIHQMERLAEEIVKRGGIPQSAEQYKLDYWHVLLARVAERVRTAEAAELWAVPGCLELLKHLEGQGVPLYLVSGSELGQVQQEADFLGVSRFFGDRIFAPRGDRDGFLKAKIVQKILEDHGLTGEQLLGFGDGVVETRDVHQAGGFSVGVASRWERDGAIHDKKRDRLVEAGASLVIPDYRHFPHWLPQIRTS